MVENYRARLVVAWIYWITVARTELCVIFLVFPWWFRDSFCNRMIPSGIQSREVGKERGAYVSWVYPSFKLCSTTFASISSQSCAAWPLQAAKRWFLQLGTLSSPTNWVFVMRKKGKAEGCLDHNHLLSARHCSKHFTCNSLEPHNNPAMWILINYYRKWRLEYVRHLSHSQ